jgi:hypothetical protein
VPVDAEKEPVAPALFSIVCDDVRLEVGQKHSYMGIYTNSVILPSFPFTLPKLCFVLQFRFLAMERPSQLAFLVERDSEVIARMEVDMLNLGSYEVEAEEGETQVVVVGSIIQVLGLTFEGPAKLRMRAETNSGIIKGGVVPVVGN